MTKDYFTALMEHIGYTEEQISAEITAAEENAEAMESTLAEELERQWNFFKIYG